MANCANCGAELQENAKFCMECGEMVAKKKFCSQCGTELPSEAKFCFSCGAKTTDEAPSVSNDSERKPSSRGGLIGNFFRNVKTLSNEDSKYDEEYDVDSNTETNSVYISRDKKTAETPSVQGSAFEALYKNKTKCIEQLRKDMDSWFDDPVRDEDKPFLMPIEKIYTISGKGTVVAGRIERGIVNIGDSLEIVGIRPTQNTTAMSIKHFDKFCDMAKAGDDVGILVCGIEKKGVERGQVLAKPGTIHPHRKFEAHIYALSQEEGGRKTPFFSGYRPQFYFRTTDITGTVNLEAGTDMVRPGDNVRIIVEPIHPIVLNEGLKFAIREGGLTIAFGMVTKIIE